MITEPMSVSGEIPSASAAANGLRTARGWLAKLGGDRIIFAAAWIGWSSSSRSSSPART
jgi:hypothetical protein